jgi:Flp pilus assembly protein TadD
VKTLEVHLRVALRCGEVGASPPTKPDEPCDVKHTQNNYCAHNNLGFSASVQGPNRLAGEHFRRAIERNPYYAKADFNMGVILPDQGKENEAVVYFRKAVALRPTSVFNNFALGRNLVDQGQKEGNPYLSTALQLPNNSSEAHNIVRAILRAAGRTENKSLPIHTD